MSDTDQKALITLAQAMGEVKKGLDSVEKQVTELKRDYNEGREKARDAHAQTVAILGEKMDRSEFETKYKGVIKIQWLWENWSIVLLIIALLVGGGWLRYGEKWKGSRERLEKIEMKKEGRR